MSLVEIRPLPLVKWHGKKEKESFGQPITEEVLVSEYSGKFNTGLTEEEAEKYGKLLGVDLSDNFNPDTPHAYWSTKAAWMTLPNRTMILDTSKPNEFVKVKNIKASNRVANSMREWEDNKWPNATHVIFDEEEDLENKATKIAIRTKAIIKAAAMSLESKANIVQILSEKTVKNRSLNFVDVEIDEIINSKPDEFLKVVDMGSAEVTVRAKVLEMISKNILTKEGGSIYYMGDLIGMDYEDAVRWFKDPNNQMLKVNLMEKLEKMDKR